MTRAESLERIKHPEMNEEFLRQEFEYIAGKLEISTSELNSLFESPLKTYRDYKNKSKLIGFGAQVMRSIGREKRYFR